MAQLADFMRYMYQVHMSRHARRVSPCTSTRAADMLAHVVAGSRGLAVRAWHFGALMAEVRLRRCDGVGDPSLSDAAPPAGRRLRRKFGVCPGLGAFASAFSRCLDPVCV